LRETPGVTVDLYAVDCLDVVATKKLFMNLKYTVAGVFYIPVLLNDRLFTDMTAEEDWRMGA
jgi:fatty acid synthase